MKKLTILLGFIAFSTSIFGQKMEIRGVLNSGLMSFTGVGADDVTFMNANGIGQNAFVNSPLGSKNGICYGLSVDVRRVTKPRIVIGLEVGVEVLRSKVSINGINGVGVRLNASGSSNSIHNFLVAQPYLGYRFKAAGFNIDWTIGLDVAYNLGSKVKGNATASDGKVFTADYKRTSTAIDLRPRTQIAVSSDKIGAFVGYSFGGVNYNSGYSGGSVDCFSRLIRFGLTYQVQ